MNTPLIIKIERGEQTAKKEMTLEVIISGNKIFAPLKGKDLVLTPEEKVRQNFICRLVNHFGYALPQMAQEVKVNNSKRGQGKAMADIVIWKNEKERIDEKSPVVVVECKAEHITIHEEDYYQGFNYASWAGADFFITTNLKDIKVFKVMKGKMPKKLEEIVDLPKASDFTNDKKIQELLAKTKAFTRYEFSKLLFKCHNIIRNNDKLSPEAAFDEISKILFMKIRYERNPDEHTIFTKEIFKKQEAHYEKNIRPVNVKLQGQRMDIPYMDYWFELTKTEFAEDEIFDENDKIRIKQGSFEAIIELLEKYNLSDTSDDVKGIAFEEFLGKTFRGELGQFFTPRTMVDYMVNILDPLEGETVCDPCCGSGGFLIKAFEYVRNNIELEIQEQKAKIKEQYYTDNFDKLQEKKQAEIEATINDLFNKLNAELDLKNLHSRIRMLSYDCIFGTDANPRMARTAKMNMIMHGDGHGGVHHHDGLLNVNGIYDERFDVILTNPPFGARVEKSLKVTQADMPPQEKIDKYNLLYPDYETNALSQIKSNINKSLLELYDVGSMTGLTEVLFIERCIRLLKPGGRMAIVLPEGVLNNPILQKVRDYVEGKAKIINITSIPQDVFIASGATVKPSLVFLKKFTDDEAKQYMILKKHITVQVDEKYQLQIDEASAVLEKAKAASKSSKKKDTLKDAQKKAKDKLKEIEAIKEDEINQELKKSFNYTIPIVEVEKAGISSTGAKIENELEPVAEEFTEYRKKSKLWGNKIIKVTYPIDENGNIMRIMGVSEPKVFYG